jgi:23S rRNA pseudouridine1911/1915/1917 synthase
VTPEGIRVQVPGRDEAWQTVTVESPLPPDMKALLG